LLQSGEAAVEATAEATATAAEAEATTLLRKEQISKV